MKILLINKFFYMRGGSETYTFALADALKAKGHDVIFFAMQDKKNLPSEYSKYFVPNVDYNGKTSVKSKITAVKNFFYSNTSAEKMEELIQNEKPDIAHIGLLHRQITFSVVDVLKKHNIPVVMSMHDLIFACPNYTMLSQGENCEACVKGSVFNCIRRKCVKDSTGKSVLAACEKEFLVRKKLYDKVDLYITECEFYKSLFKQSHVTRSRIICMTNFLPVSQKYEFDRNYSDYILYFGRFSKEKGILTLLKAHEILKCKYRLVLVGGGAEESNIRRFVESHHLTNVELPGAIYGEKMDVIIKNAKAVVVPSEWYENCPYALLQSLAKGKVTIVSGIGGLPELVSDGETGYLFKPGDSRDLAEKIEKVYSMDKPKYEAISQRICAEAKKTHYWESYTDALLEEYVSLINAK